MAPWRDVLLCVSDAQAPLDHSSLHVCCDNVAVSCCCEHVAQTEDKKASDQRSPRPRRHGHKQTWALAIGPGERVGVERITPSFLSKPRRQGVWLGSTRAVRRRKDLRKCLKGHTQRHFSARRASVLGGVRLGFPSIPRLRVAFFLLFFFRVVSLKQTNFVSTTPRPLVAHAGSCIPG